jgi:hypothetical protein
MNFLNPQETLNNSFATSSVFSGFSFGPSTGSFSNNSKPDSVITESISFGKSDSGSTSGFVKNEKDIMQWIESGISHGFVTDKNVNHFIALISSKSVDINQLLTVACHFGNMSLVAKLLELGANIESKTASGTTPLMRVAKNGYLELFKFLLEKGADINAVDAQKNDIFHHAKPNIQAFIWNRLKHLLHEQQKPLRSGFTLA